MDDNLEDSATPLSIPAISTPHRRSRHPQQHFCRFEQKKWALGVRNCNFSNFDPLISEKSKTYAKSDGWSKTQQIPDVFGVVWGCQNHRGKVTPWIILGFWYLFISCYQICPKRLIKRANKIGIQACRSSAAGGYNGFPNLGGCSRGHVWWRLAWIYFYW